MRRTPLLLLLVACGGTGGDSPPPEPPAIESADALFDEAEFNDVSLTLAPEDFDAILNDVQDRTWRRATMQWRDERVDPVGVRSSDGGRVAGDPKMSLEVRFDAFVPGRRFQGLEILKVKGMRTDPSFLRARLSLSVFRERMAASRAAHCRLFVNGEYRGVFLLEERVDGPMVESAFGGARGDLYRIDSFGSDPYRWVDFRSESYVPVPWRPTTNETTADHSRVVNLLDVLHTAPESLDTVCEVEALLEYLALEAAVNDSDGMAGDIGSTNHYQYFRFETGRFTTIGWDFDSTWDDDPERSLWWNFANSALTTFIESDTALRERYKRRIAEVVATATDPARILERIDFICGQIREAVYADPYKPFTNADFESQRLWIREFATRRAASLRRQVGEP